jgi:flavin-dependent dehydrogenase
MNVIQTGLLDRLNRFVQAIKEQSDKRTRLQKWLIVGGGFVVLVIVGKLLLTKRRRRISKIDKTKSPYQLVKNNENRAENEYDVIVAGGGVSGTACAVFLAKKGLDVLVLEKSTVADDGVGVDDIVPMRAQKILQEIGILKACAGNAINKTTFVSTRAVSTVTSVHDTTGVVYKNSMSIKGSSLRDNLVTAAKKANVTYLEGHEVEKTRWSPVEKMWTIDVNQNGEKKNFKARATVLADGADCELAKKLRLVKTEPDSVRSRTQFSQKTMDVDHIIAFSKSVLPGYCSLVKYSDGDVGFSTIVLPGNSRAQPKDIQDLHRSCASEETTIRNVLGGGAEHDDMSVAQLRTGGIERSFKDHMVVIGDAAGLVDPLTMSSIAYSLESAKFAAEVLYEGFQYGDLSDKNLRRYQEKWQDAFEDDFHWSSKIRSWIVRYPVLLDATVSLSKKRGNVYASELSQVLLGAKNKGWFLRPDVAFFYLIEIVRLSWF